MLHALLVAAHCLNIATRFTAECILLTWMGFVMHSAKVSPPATVRHQKAHGAAGQQCRSCNAGACHVEVGKLICSQYFVLESTHFVSVSAKQTSMYSYIPKLGHMLNHWQYYDCHSTAGQSSWCCTPPASAAGLLLLTTCHCRLLALYCTSVKLYIVKGSSQQLQQT